MKRTAQSTIEYAVLIAVIAAALAVTAVYAKRAIQGRIRAGADQVSSEGAYMPGGTQAAVVVTRTIEETSSTYVVKPEGSSGENNSLADMIADAEARGLVAETLAGSDIAAVDKTSAIGTLVDALLDTQGHSTAGSGSERKSITDTTVTIEQKTIRQERVVPAAGGR